MSVLLYDLQRSGLAGAAIVFTMAAFSAAICGLVVYGLVSMEAGFSRRHGIISMVVFWALCMIFTWRYLARARASWPETLTSTSLFHLFQSLAIVLIAGFAAMSGGLQSITFLWCVFMIEVVVGFFYFSYVFLGLTLRYRMPRSAVPGFVITFALLCWQSLHLPPL